MGMGLFEGLYPHHPWLHSRLCVLLLGRSKRKEDSQKQTRVFLLRGGVGSQWGVTSDLGPPELLSTHTGQNVPHSSSGFSCLSRKEVTDPSDTVLKVPSFTLLGVLVTITIHDMFERREGFFPPGQPLPVALSSLGDPPRRADTAEGKSHGLLPMCTAECVCGDIGLGTWSACRLQLGDEGGTLGTTLHMGL